MRESLQRRSNMTRRRALRKDLTVLIGLALSLAQVAPAQAANKPQPDPTPLWRAFPLRGVEGKQQPRTGVGPPARSQPVDQLPDDSSIESHGGGTERVALMIAVAGGILALLVLISKTKREMSSSGPIRRDWASREAVHEAEEDGASRLEEVITSYSLFPSPGSDSESGPDDAEERARLKRAEARPIATYEDLRPTIANVLMAAEAEAAQQLDSARPEAQAIRETAESQAKADRGAFEAGAEGRGSQLAQLRKEADRYAEEHRREADADAQRLREQGEAVKLRLEEEGRARRQELEQASSRLEDQLRVALTAYKGVVAELEELLAEQPPQLDEELFRQVNDVTKDVESRNA